MYVSGSTVDVIMDQCCYAQPETPLIWTSTDGGMTFGAPVFVGDTNNANVEQSDNSLVVADGDLVWEDGGGGDVKVDAVSLTNFDQNEETSASVVPNGSGDQELKYSGIGTYAGGVLVGASTFGNPASTTVYYAPAGQDPGLLSSYHDVGTFADATFEFLEGGALITQLNDGSQSYQIRLFNGTSFGAAHTIPDTNGGGPGWTTGGISAAGRVYIFSERNQDSYHLEVQSTTDGIHWTPRSDLGSADYAYSFNAALDAINTGIIVGSPNPVEVYPVLAAQSVSFALSKTKVLEGTTVTATGKTGYPSAGRKIELERWVAGAWHSVAATTENAAGKFTFHITEHSAATYTFRAVAADEIGYVQYGYSARKSLKVTKPAH